MAAGSRDNCAGSTGYAFVVIATSVCFAVSPCMNPIQFPGTFKFWNGRTCVHTQAISGEFAQWALFGSYILPPRGRPCGKKRTWKSSARNVGPLRVPGPGQTASPPAFAPPPFASFPLPHPPFSTNTYAGAPACCYLAGGISGARRNGAVSPLSPSSSGFQSHARRRETRRHGDVCPPSLPLLLVSIGS